MPVFNRLDQTRAMLGYLRAQICEIPLTLIVVDDGSTDGTAEYLRSESDVTALQGNGALWWGGGIDVGLRHAFSKGGAEDWVLLVNNDTRIEPDFVQRLLNVARAYAPAAVGSVIRDERKPHRLLSTAVRIDANRLTTVDLLQSHDPTEQTTSGPMQTDALSGRGVLFPMAALVAVNGMRAKWVPHYLADYELSVRVKAAGYKLLVDPGAAVYSEDHYGSSYRGKTFKEKFFSVRSPAYLPAVLIFWWRASSALQKFTLLPRLVLLLLFPKLRNLGGQTAR